MRILHFIGRVNRRRSAETFLAQLAISQRSHAEVHVATYAGILDSRGRQISDEFAERDVTLHCLKANGRWSVPVALSRLIEDVQPDVVNCHLEAPELFCMFSARLTRVRPIYVRTIQNQRINRVLSRVLQPSLTRFFDCSVAVSEVVATLRRLPENKTEIIYNGIAIHNPDPSVTFREPAAIRGERGLPIDRVLLIHIGSMSPRGGVLQKAQDILLRAFSKSNLSNEGVCLVLLGDGIYRSRLEEEAQSLGITDDVVFVGVTNNVSEYIEASDVAVLPSRFEGLPLAGIECVTAGLPIVVSDIDVMEVFDLDSTLKCQVNDVESLAETMRTACRDREALSRAACVNAARYRERFDINAIAEKYLKLYRRLQRSSHSQSQCETEQFASMR